jgi:hypothetical protein
MPRWPRCSRKAGGISLYAHGRGGYLTFVGPVATFGYWFAWSSVLAINGYVIGTLVQAEWFENTTFTQDVGNFQWSLPVWIGIGCILAVWLFNIYGVRPAVWLSYVTGGLLILPAAVLMFLPYITGDWSSDNMTWAIGSGGGLGLALTWLYFMGWSSYGFETVAAFAPEYHNPEWDTPRALRARPAHRSSCTPRCRSASAERFGTEAIANDATAIAFYTQASTCSSAMRSRTCSSCLIAAAPVDEHRDHGRLAGAVWHLPGRHDDESAWAG